MSGEKNAKNRGKGMLLVEKFKRNSNLSARLEMHIGSIFSNPTRPEPETRSGFYRVDPINPKPDMYPQTKICALQKIISVHFLHKFIGRYF